jgi:hypothetical protein
MTETLHIPLVLLLLEALVMTVALLAVLWALRIRDLEAVHDGPDFLILYRGDSPDTAQFFEYRVVDYAFASYRNKKLNKEMATPFAWASRSMAVRIRIL